MALAILVFLSGSHKYKFERPTGSPIVTAVKISWCAAVEYLGGFVSSSTDHETSHLWRPHENVQLLLLYTPYHGVGTIYNLNAALSSMVHHVLVECTCCHIHSK